MHWNVVYPLSAGNIQTVQANSANLPSLQTSLFETTDMDLAREEVGKVFCPHTIDFAGTGRRLAMRQSSTSIGHLLVSRIAYGEEVEIDAGEPDVCFMVHAIDSGHCRMKIGGREVMANQSTSVVTSATLSLAMQWSANCSHLVLKVQRSVLERHLCGLLDSLVALPIEFQPDLSSDSFAFSSYRRTLDFITGEIDRDNALFHSRLGVTQLEQMLMTLMLTTLPHNYSSRLSAPVSRAAPRHVVRAEEFINAHAQDPITIHEIAQASGASVRTLFDGFRRFRGTSPLAHLKYVRLDRARAELRSPDTTGSVTDIALKWGFLNPGRFARDYQNRYGELPSQTRRLTSLN